MVLSDSSVAWSIMSGQCTLSWASAQHHLDVARMHAFLPARLPAGDVAGVWYNRVDHTITFTKNGRSLGVAFRDVPDLTFYPSIGFRTPDEEVGGRL